MVYASDDLSVSAGRSGQGTLIVTGTLTMNGSFSWDGSCYLQFAQESF